MNTPQEVLKKYELNLYDIQTLRHCYYKALEDFAPPIGSNGPPDGVVPGYYINGNDKLMSKLQESAKKLATSGFIAREPKRMITHTMILTSKGESALAEYLHAEKITGKRIES